VARSCSSSDLALVVIVALRLLLGFAGEFYWIYPRYDH
jgi:hypothetical protein